MLPIAKRDYQLSSGEIISVGVNFRALELMSRYPGGLNRMKKDMQKIATLDPESEETEESEESEEYGEGIEKAMSAMGHMLYSLIAAGGTACSEEEAMMAIGPQDFEQLNTIFEEFSETMNSISQKKTMNAAARRT